MQTKNLISCIIPLVALLSCGSVSAADLVIPGSGNPEYVLGVLAREFNARHGEHRVLIPSSTGTGSGIRDVQMGTAIVGRVGRRLTDAEMSKGLSYVPVGIDAVVFVAGAGITTRSVTSEQMIAAYTGKVADWRELGAKPAPIRVIGRQPSDTSRMSIAAHIPAFKDMAFGNGVKIVHLDPQMVELLDRFETSLGMLNRSGLYAAKTKLVPLALDAVEPTPENLLSGRYQMWLEFGLVHKSGTSLPAEARAFLNFVKSPEGARILRAHGIAPVKDNT